MKGNDLVNRNKSRMTKRILFCFAFLTMVFTLMIVNGTSAEIASGDIYDLSWVLADDGTLTITGSGEMKYVYSANPWRDYKEQITKVIIGDGVTNVGVTAFSNCVNLWVVR